MNTQSILKRNKATQLCNKLNHVQVCNFCKRCTVPFNLKCDPGVTTIQLLHLHFGTTDALGGRLPSSQNFLSSNTRDGIMEHCRRIPIPALVKSWSRIATFSTLVTSKVLTSWSLLMVSCRFILSNLWSLDRIGSETSFSVLLIV